MHQGTRAAPDIDDALVRDHPGKVRHLRRQEDGVAAHEPVVGLGGDVETHVRMLLRGRAFPTLPTCSHPPRPAASSS